MAWYMQNYITFSNITPKIFGCPRSSFYDGKQNLHIISARSVCGLSALYVKLDFNIMGELFTYFLYVSARTIKTNINAI